MSSGEKLSERLFRLVCLSFSALLLVLGLFWQIRLVRLEAEIDRLESALRAAQDEGKHLTILLESRPTLAELEETALTKLGMQHPTQGQIIEIEYLG
ncbi:MAG: hypothetical protein K6F56_03725 [Oscillospiraceae bacterium]|nr:hypothetical protein [Oscillospiraceae bacterium]